MSRPVWGRCFGPVSRRAHALVSILTLTGAAVIAVLSVDLALLAAAAPPEESPPPRPAPPGGALVICGGGVIPEVVRARFVELAGGPGARIVVIPTAHRIADTPAVKSILDPWMTRGAASVQCLHTRSRDVANTAEFVQPLKEATGVWFGGGLQSAVTQAYLGTEVERQLSALLERGGVIGGTSAGAAVMTRVMISRGRTTAEVDKGFDFLPGAVVDQHFLRRNRLSRLLSVLSDHPDLVGFGIDERTALVVDIRSRRMNVIGDSYVMACVPGPTGQPARLEILKPGDEASFARLTGEQGPALTIAPALRLGAP